MPESVACLIPPRASGEMNQYSAPAARVLNTDAGAPPARGGDEAGNACGRRGFGHAGMQDRPGGGQGRDALHGRAPGRGTKYPRMRAEEGAGQAHRSAEAGAVGGQ